MSRGEPWYTLGRRHTDPTAGLLRDTDRRELNTTTAPCERLPHVVNEPPVSTPDLSCLSEHYSASY